MLHHIGRKSGQPRQAVLEVAAHRTEPDEYVVASGFGFKSDWYLNLKKKTPDVLDSGWAQKMDVTAELLSAEQSGERMVQYAGKYPRSARNLCRVLGHETDGSATRYREIGEKFVLCCIPTSLTTKRCRAPTHLVKSFLQIAPIHYNYKSQEHIEATIALLQNTFHAGCEKH